MKKDKKEEIKEEIKPHKFIKLLLTLVIIIFIIGLYSRYIETNIIITKEYAIKDINLPDNYNGLKIIQLSDIYYSNTINKNNLEKIVNKINELKPDIILFTGNLFESNTNITDELKQEVEDTLKKLDATIGKYAITANDDETITNYSTIIEDSGFTLLDNEVKTIYYNSITPIDIIGYTNNPNVTDESSNYKIGLIHNKDNISKITNNLNIIFTGNNNDNQIIIPYLNSTPNYYEQDNIKVYTSNGLGTKRNLKFRLFNYPSISLYRFYTN